MSGKFPIVLGEGTIEHIEKLWIDGKIVDFSHLDIQLTELPIENPPENIPHRIKSIEDWLQQEDEEILYNPNLPQQEVSGDVVVTWDFNDNSYNHLHDIFSYAIDTFQDFQQQVDKINKYESIKRTLAISLITITTLLAVAEFIFF